MVDPKDILYVEVDDKESIVYYEQDSIRLGAHYGDHCDGVRCRRVVSGVGKSRKRCRREMGTVRKRIDKTEIFAYSML